MKFRLHNEQRSSPLEYEFHASCQDELAAGLYRAWISIYSQEKNLLKSDEWLLAHKARTVEFSGRDQQLYVAERQREYARIRAFQTARYFLHVGLSESHPLAPWTHAVEYYDVSGFRHNLIVNGAPNEQICAQKSKSFFQIEAAVDALEMWTGFSAALLGPKI